MKKEVKTRIWGFFETLAFCGIYMTAAYIARFLMYLFYAVYFAVSSYLNNEIFLGDEFMAELNRTISTSRTELTILADILMIALCAVVIYARGGRFKKYIGIEKTSVLQILGALIAGAAIWYVSIIALSDLLAGSQALENYGVHVSKLHQSSPIIVFILTVIIAPITEEIVFRGALFSSITRFLNKPIAVIVTSLLFAIVHVDPVQMGYAFVLGVMLAFIRAETGRILPCIAMHFAFNLMNYFISGYIMPIWVAIVICCGGYALALYKKV